MQSFWLAPIACQTPDFFLWLTKKNIIDVKAVISYLKKTSNPTIMMISLNIMKGDITRIMPMIN